MVQLVANNDNTAFFGRDYNNLLLTLVKFELLLLDPKYEEFYYYQHRIWAGEKGWFLTFQTYDKQTNQPCVVNR